MCRNQPHTSTHHVVLFRVACTRGSHKTSAWLPAPWARPSTTRSRWGTCAHWGRSVCSRAWGRGTGQRCGGALRGHTAPHRSSAWLGPPWSAGSGGGRRVHRRDWTPWGRRGGLWRRNWHATRLRIYYLICSFRYFELFRISERIFLSLKTCSNLLQSLMYYFFIIFSANSLPDILCLTYIFLKIHSKYLGTHQMFHLFLCIIRT